MHTFDLELILHVHSVNRIEAEIFWKYSNCNIGIFQCVTLHGTLYRKDGIISGGLALLEEKSKQLDEKTYMELKSKKVTNFISDYLFLIT